MLLLNFHSLFIPRFDVATYLNIPVESTVLSIILDQLDHDMDWDKDDLVQKGYWVAGEPRYDLSQLKKSYTKTSDTGFVNEKLVNTSEKKTKALDNPSSSSNTRIKLEFPLWNKFVEKGRVLKNGKGYLLLQYFAHYI